MAEDKCNDIGKKLSSAFDMVLQDYLDSGEPAELGLSDFDFVTNFGHVEGVMDEALDEIDERILKDCGMTKDDAFDIMEGHWQKRFNRGDFKGLSKKKEEL